MKKVFGVLAGLSLIVGLLASSLFAASTTAQDATPMASPMADGDRCGIHDHHQQRNRSRHAGGRFDRRCGCG